MAKKTKPEGLNLHPGVGYAINRGEKIVKENNYQLPRQVIYLFMDVPKANPFVQ